MGKYTARDGKCYNGQWQKHVREGFGTELIPNGEKYEGHWIANKKHGNGCIRFRNGKIREGEWKDGERIRWTSEPKRVPRRSSVAETATPKKVASTGISTQAAGKEESKSSS